MKQNPYDWNYKIRRTAKVPIELLHRRLEHRSTRTIEFAKQKNLYEDVKIVKLHDHFCETCHLTSSNCVIEGMPRTTS